MTAVIINQSFEQGFICNRLHARINGGSYGQTAIIQHAFTVKVDQLATDFLGEEISLIGINRFTGFTNQRGCPRLLGFGLGDVIFFKHPPDDPITTCFGFVVISDRIVIGWCLWQGAKISGFFDVQLIK